MSYTHRKKHRQPIENQDRRTRVISTSILDTCDDDPRPRILFFRRRHNGEGDSTGPHIYRAGLASTKRVADLIGRIIDKGGDDFTAVRVHLTRR